MFVLSRSKALECRKNGADYTQGAEFELEAFSRFWFFSGYRVRKAFTADLELKFVDLHPYGTPQLVTESGLYAVFKGLNL